MDGEKASHGVNPDRSTSFSRQFCFRFINWTAYRELDVASRSNHTSCREQMTMFKPAPLER
jgi:hypothetical protein